LFADISIIGFKAKCRPDHPDGVFEHSDTPQLDPATLLSNKPPLRGARAKSTALDIFSRFAIILLEIRSPISLARREGMEILNPISCDRGISFLLVYLLSKESAYFGRLSGT
jgi:hypothetical protein